MDDIAILERWAGSIELFVIEALCATPTEQQLAVLQDIDAGYTDIAIKSGHGTGKSGMLSWIILWAGFFHYDTKIPATAPTAPQLTRLLIPEVRKWVDKLPQQLKEAVTVNQDIIKFTNDNIAVPRTARKEAPEGLQGFHATYLVWIIDEASGVDNIIFEVIDGSLTGDKHLRVMTANPTRTEGRFYDAFHKDRDLWRLHTFNAEKSSNVSKKSIEAKKKQYGEDSDAYRVRVLGQFPRSNSDAVIPLWLIEDAQSRESFNSFGAEVWGLDYADSGADSTQLAKRKGNHFYEVLECDVGGSHRHAQTAEWLALQYAKATTKPQVIFIDAIGEGSGLVSVLRMEQFSHLPIVAIKGSQNAIKSEVYENKRAEMFYTLKELLEDEGKLLDDDDVVGELSAQRFKITTKGKLIIVPKEEIKASLGRSPDKADAIALCCAQPIILEQEVEQRVRESVDDDYYYGGVAW